MALMAFWTSIVNLAQSLNPDTFFEHRLYFYVPEKYGFVNVLIDNPEILYKHNLEKNILCLKLLPKKSTEGKILILFE